jgi:16S rRNA (uracil1498-N3)-methyltransferase
MRTLRCYCDDQQLRPGGDILLSEEEGRHLGTVLRARVGFHVEVLDGAGGLAFGDVTEGGKGGWRIAIRELAPPVARRAAPLELAPALTRTDAFDDALHRAIELGMTAFRPILSERTVVELDEKKANRRMERWQRIAVESLKQCERRWLPEVAPPVELEALLADLKTRDITPVVLLERAKDVPPLSGMRDKLASVGVCLLIGPEGGWSPEEAELLRKSGTAASLGDAILRSETAALAALALLSL